MTEAEILQSLAKYDFYHTIRLTDRISTPGWKVVEPLVEMTLRNLRTLDLRGKKVLDIGCRDGTASLFEMPSGRLLHRLAGHVLAVNHVAFSPDGRMLVTSSRDNLLKTWDVKSGRELLAIPGHTAAVTALAVSPDGRAVAAADEGGTLRLWSLGPDGATPREAGSVRQRGASRARGRRSAARRCSREPRRPMVAAGLARGPSPARARPRSRGVLRHNLSRLANEGR